jgi:hypothetical protein
LTANAQSATTNKDTTKSITLAGTDIEKPMEFVYLKSKAATSLRQGQKPPPQRRRMEPDRRGGIVEGATMGRDDDVMSVEEVRKMVEESEHQNVGVEINLTGIILNVS